MTDTPESNDAASQTAMPNPTPLEYALSIWRDTRAELISREDAAQIAEGLRNEILRIPCNLSEEFLEGWEAACETVAMALRFKDFHM